MDKDQHPLLHRSQSLTTRPLTRVKRLSAWALIALLACQQKEHGASHEKLQELRLNNEPEFLKQSVKLMKDPSLNPIERSDVYAQQGHYYFSKAGYDSAFAYFEKSYTLREVANDSERMANSLVSKAEIMGIRGDLHIRDSLYKQSIALRKNPENLCDDCINLAVAQANSKTFKQALANFKKALNLSVQLNDPYRKGKVCLNLSELYSSLYQFDSARYFLHQAKNNPSYANSPGGRLFILLAQAGLCYDQSDMDSAIFFYNQAFDEASVQKNREKQLYILKIKSVIAEYLGHKDEFIHLLKWERELADSMFSENIQQTIASLSVKHDLERKAQQNKVLELRNKNHLTLIGLLISGLLIAILLAYFFIYRSRNLLQLRNIEMDNLMKTQEIKMMDARVAGSDAERQKIAQEIHDSLSVNLNLVNLFVSRLDPDRLQLNDAEKAVFDRTSETIHTAMTELKRITNEMDGIAVSELGLKNTLEKTLHAISQSSDIVTHLDTDGLDRLSAEQSMNIFRIVQVLISNTLRHADAKIINISFAITGGRFLSMLYEDNGKGFEFTKINKGLGMVSIERRISKLNATFDIETSLRKGFRFRAEIPL